MDFPRSGVFRHGFRHGSTFSATVLSTVFRIDWPRAGLVRPRPGPSDLMAMRMSVSGFIRGYRDHPIYLTPGRALRQVASRRRSKPVVTLELAQNVKHYFTQIVALVVAFPMVRSSVVPP